MNPNNGSSVASASSTRVAELTPSTASTERQQTVERALETRDPGLRNLRFTQAYSDFSREMRDLIGEDAGANWATWAAWASNSAGPTIRGEGLPGRWSPIAPLTRAAMAEGNREIFESTAPHFARFLDTFEGSSEPDPRRLRQFLRGFGRGEETLREGFTNYYRAMHETDPDAQQELMYTGNMQVFEHEQRVVQNRLEQAMPWGTRTAGTRMAELELPNSEGGREGFPVSQDVPTFRGSSASPALQQIDNRDTAAVIRRWDANPRSVEGSAASDWTDIDQRMQYVGDLFRSRHDDPALFQQVFTPRQRQQIERGEVPSDL